MFLSFLSCYRPIMTSSQPLPLSVSPVLSFIIYIPVFLLSDCEKRKRGFQLRPAPSSSLMSALLSRRAANLTSSCAQTLRRLSTSTTSAAQSSSTASASEPLTHFKITLRRSAIALPERYAATLRALGLRKRLQTVFHPHGQVAAGMILRVKELVQVSNVPASAVRTRAELREERRPPRGYHIEADGSSRAAVFE